MPQIRKPDPTLFDRGAAVGVLDEDKRTAEVVWSTGAQVKRFNWMREEYYLEELSLDPKHVRLDRLNDGAPLLNAHSSWALGDVIGKVEPGSASVDGKQGRATVRFSKRADVEPIWADVRDGIITKVSIGYRVNKFERIAPAKEGDLAIYRAVDWEVYEVSPVPIPADPGAGFRAEDAKDQPFPAVLDHPISRAAAHPPKEVNMTEEEKKAAAEAEAKRKQEEEAKRKADLEAADAEKKRVAEEARKAAVAHMREVETIVRTAKQSGVDLGDDFARDHAEKNTPLDEVRKLAFDALAKRSGGPGEIRPTVRVGLEAHEKLHARAIDAVLQRAGVVKLTGDAAAAAREFGGLTLRELARDLLEMRGIRTRGMAPFHLVGVALGLDDATRASVLGAQGTSDLSNILANVMGKTLRAQYEGSQRTFQLWAKRSSAMDFKTIQRTAISGAPSLVAVTEAGEFTRGTVSDGKETYNLATYGKTVAFTRQAIINDDLSALTRMPSMMGRAAADLESDTVYAVLTANAALADTVALFEATTHKNYTSSGTAIDVTSLSVARALMRVQTGLEGRLINIVPRFLIVPAAKETIAYQYTSPNYQPTAQSGITDFARGGRTPLEPVVEPRLDAASTTAWYLAADPAQVDTIEYCYLEGNEDPYIETRAGFEVDGVEMKVRHDFASKAIDYRGLYKNVGA